MIAQRRHRPLYLAPRLGQRLALLLRQKRSEIRGPALQRIGQRRNPRATLGKVQRAPAGKGPLPGHHRPLHLRRIGTGRGGKDLPVRRIDKVDRARAIDQLTIDKKLHPAPLSQPCSDASLSYSEAIS